MIYEYNNDSNYTLSFSNIPEEYSQYREIIKELRLSSNDPIYRH